MKLNDGKENVKGKQIGVPVCTMNSKKGMEGEQLSREGVLVIDIEETNQKIEQRQKR